MRRLSRSLCGWALRVRSQAASSETRVRSSVPDLRTWCFAGRRVKRSPAPYHAHADCRSPRGSPLRRVKLDAEAGRRGISSFRGCSSRPAVRIMASDTSIPQLRKRGGYPMKALRTLVVEDDAILGELLAKTLEGLGHGVCAVETNVAKAVAAASHWRPDFMIVDVGLGEAERPRRCQRDPPKQIRATRVCHRECGEGHAFGSRYRPHSKAVPRVGSGARNSNGACHGARFRPSRGEA